MKKLLAAVLVAGLAFIACQKEYSYETGADAASTGAWEFKDSINTLYTGNPVEYYVDDTTDPTSAHMVYSGATASLNATISIEVFFPTGTAATGTYTSAAGQVNFLYLTNTGRFYKVDAFAGQTSTENISVSITAISDTSVTGTFAGTALDSTNRLIPIREGKFTYRKRATATTPSASAGSLSTGTDTTCTGALLSGTYRRGTPMTGSNTLTITANVTTPGTYSIFSDTLKGIRFAGTGTFTTTGVQSVVIPALGTPTDTGITRFRIRYGTSNCTFQVRIDTGTAVTPPTGDYFPITTNSNWSYDHYDSGMTAPIDTQYIRSTGATSVFSGNTFNQFISNDGFALDTSYYRKGSGLYYTTIDLQNVIQAGGVVSTTFLKDNVAVNATWTESYNVTISGVPATVKADNIILAKAVAATVGTFTSPDVIKVRTTISIGVLGNFTAFGIQENWYAKGVGLIYAKQIDPTGVSPYIETRMRRYYIAP